MKILFVFLALVAASRGFQISDMMRAEFQVFKLKFNKTYDSPEEEMHHLKTYLENRFMVARHNRRYHRGLETFQLKLNEFADIPPKTFIKTRNGFRRNSVRKNGRRRPTFLPPYGTVLPDTVDWRRLGAVTDIKNQKECQSCWAFAATGALEGQLYRKYGKLISLSEQNLVDCSSGDDSCDVGGNFDRAFEYIMVNKGIDEEVKYPYEGINNRCRYNPDYSAGDDVGYSTIPEGDDMLLMGAVATVGPIAVAVDANSRAFQFYSGGVFYYKHCSMEDVNHSMLLVGYGTEKGQDYWLLKNSSGVSWGEAGYMRLARNETNYCGVASFGAYPLV